MKMKKSMVVLLMLLAVILAAGCSKTEAPGPESVSLNIAAAASLQDAGEEIKTLYVAQHPEVEIILNFEASGTLQKQIEEGAPADLFISAGASQMDALAAKDLIVAESRKNLLGNELVLIAGKDSALQDFAGLADPAVKRISIGAPETVPAGKYAQEALTSLNLWDQIQSKLVFGNNVRQVLTYVQTGNVEAGLVYKSDTYEAADIKIVASAPADSHKPIVYPLAVVKASNNQEAAQAFADYLFSDEAAAVFTKYGFTVIKE